MSVSASIASSKQLCEEQQPAPTAIVRQSIKQTESIQEVKEAFLAHGYEQQLAEQVNSQNQAASNRTWVPLWDDASQQSTPQATTCTYIPLLAQGQKGSPVVTLLGIQKYLLATRSNNGLDFSVATYLYNDPQNGASPASDRSFFATFTGVVLLQHLPSGRVTRFTYQKGKQQRPQVIASSPTTTASSRTTVGSPDGLITTNSMVCNLYTICYWSGTYSGSTGLGATVYGSVTTSPGAGSCSLPTGGNINGGGSAINWQLTGQSVGQQCQETTPGGGPNPLPGSGGGGGSGGAAATEFDNYRIDDKALSPCIIIILNRIKLLGSGKVADIVRTFSGQTPSYNWKLQSGTLPQGKNGSTGPYDQATGRITTTFDPNQFTQATDLSIARTIMHEAIHAYLLTYFFNDRINANKTYPELVTAYAQSKNVTGNAAQHDEMVRGWIQEIGYSLKQYGQSQGYILTNEFYVNMAWGGLEGTPAFRSLTAAQQRQIHDTILTELTGTDSSGNSSTQLGTRAGC